MAYSTFTLTGKHTTPTGKAHAGQVVVTPNTEIRDTTGKVILSGSEKVTLDASGAWSITLPCDGSGLNPSSGIGYRVAWDLRAAQLKPRGFAALPELAGTTLDVADITGGTTPAAPATVPVAGPQGIPGPQGDVGPMAPAQFAYDTDGVPYLTI